jgi:hypothetical protein
MRRRADGRRAIADERSNDGRCPYLNSGELLPRRLPLGPSGEIDKFDFIAVRIFDKRDLRSAMFHRTGFSDNLRSLTT